MTMLTSTSPAGLFIIIRTSPSAHQNICSWWSKQVLARVLRKYACLNFELSRCQGMYWVLCWNSPWIQLLRELLTLLGFLSKSLWSIVRRREWRQLKQWILWHSWKKSSMFTSVFMYLKQALIHREWLQSLHVHQLELFPQLELCPGLFTHCPPIQAGRRLTISMKLMPPSQALKSDWSAGIRSRTLISALRCIKKLRA